jgi:uncharacterized protein
MESPPSSPPPGWYPDPQVAGRQRWWDGHQWGVDAPLAVPYGGSPAGPEDQRTLAVLAHVLGIFTGFLGPLVLYLVAKPGQPYAKHHAAESLNFQIMLTIAWVVTFALMFVLIGLLIAPVLWIGSLVLEIMAAAAASRGDWYRYPVNLRLVPGAQG